ncbi:hypothetical protein DFP72DRAFT_1066947 [Ephemerocybe angulata]|uniref:F-box domain-containing protein n=1 Tax=Ephemerocybe angulata TaxID=980116 RepID=A0A8H6I019_9AGAR|nr:hypothetical protein DFP72DRAFT_1066947 [Tulosesus angulatus]
MSFPIPLSATSLSSSYVDSFQASFHPLLSSNSTPSQCQADFVNEHLGELTRQVKSYKTLIKALDAQRRICLSILSPLRRIPLEILGEIFKLVVPFYLHALDRVMLGNLGRVCRRWRDALLNTPSVWRGLVMGPCTCGARSSYEAARVHDEDYAKISTWYKRAGGSPKALIYSASSPRCDCVRGGSCQAVHPLVTRLLKEGPALDHITLQVSSTACFRKWVAAVGGFSSGTGAGLTQHFLRSFSLEFVDDVHHPWDDELESNDSVFNLLPTVPTLGIHLPSCGDAFDAVEDAASWPIRIPAPVLGQLTTLGLRWDWGGVGLLGVLAQCPALEGLTIDLSFSEPYAGQASTSPLALPRLKTFRLRMGGLCVLERLLMPSLTSLDLELNIDRHETLEVSERLKRFLVASDLLGSLQYLRICELVGAPGAVEIALPTLSALEHLVLDSSTACGYHLGEPGSLRRGPDQGAHNLPALRHLELLNLKRSRHTMLSEALYLKRGGLLGRCLITVSYAKEVQASEADLRTRLRAVRGNLLSVQVVPSVDYEGDRRQ